MKSITFTDWVLHIIITFTSILSFALCLKSFYSAFEYLEYNVPMFAVMAFFGVVSLFLGCLCIYTPYNEIIETIISDLNSNYRRCVFSNSKSNFLLELHDELAFYRVVPSNLVLLPEFDNIMGEIYDDFYRKEMLVRYRLTDGNDIKKPLWAFKSKIYKDSCDCVEIRVQGIKKYVYIDFIEKEKLTCLGLLSY